VDEANDPKASRTDGSKLKEATAPEAEPEPPFDASKPFVAADAAQSEDDPEPVTEGAIDRAEADRFLKLLDSTAVGFTFQTFDDNQDRKDKGLIRVLNGSLDEHFATLATLNAAGAGVYITVNETDLTGRKAANIERVRWLFADMDGAPRPAGPPWFMAVQSSATREHHTGARPIQTAPRSPVLRRRLSPIAAAIRVFTTCHG
jgi:hypothetical protein